MRKSGFRKKSYEEVEKQRAIRPKVGEKTLKRTKVAPLSKNTRKGQNLAKSTKKKTLLSLSKLKKKLDSTFSQYIRRKYANKDSMVKCYTCSTVRHWKEMQNGHFISRTYLVTRFDENNCRPQCVGCNMFHHGKPLDFEENLKRELGEGLIETMKSSRHQIVKLDRVWYEVKIHEYQTILDSL
jgi:hypothetical protein